MNTLPSLTAFLLTDTSTPSGHGIAIRLLGSRTLGEQSEYYRGVERGAGGQAFIFWTNKAGTDSKVEDMEWGSVRVLCFDLGSLFPEEGNQVEVLPVEISLKKETSRRNIAT